MFQGDSGGPLSYDHKGQHVLVGVTSYAMSKCGSSSVSVKEGLNALYFILNCMHLQHLQLFILLFMRVSVFPTTDLLCMLINPFIGMEHI